MRYYKKTQNSGSGQMVISIRYKTALKAKIYVKIRQEAVRQLENSGGFTKAAVLGNTGYSSLAGHIHWEHVVRMIEETHDVELVGVVAGFFKRDTTYDDVVMTLSERFLGGGSGARRTAGFIAVEPGNEASGLCSPNGPAILK